MSVGRSDMEAGSGEVHLIAAVNAPSECVGVKDTGPRMLRG